ncbi:MAG: hypothetical protein GY804_09455 [Alphaproteobacteria bacterium]|nr:hypothetical protein [Alphaproteobacteria bacterium]
MTSNYTHPHYEINVIDGTPQTPAVDEELPLHLPLIMLRAQSGEINKPMFFREYLSAQKVLGAETFNPYNELYYSKAARFALTIFPNPMWLMRIADKDTVKPAGIVIEAHVNTDADCPKWIRGSSGAVELDEKGKPTVELDGSDEPITEKGVSVTWKSRAITEPEIEAGIENIPQTGTDTEYVVPILVKLLDTPGAGGNDRAFSLYRNYKDLDLFQVQNIGSQLYCMSPKEKKYLSTVVDDVLDTNGNVFNSFSFLDNAVDPTTTAHIAFADMFPKRYDYLPATYATYPRNLEKIGNDWLSTYMSDTYTDNGVVVNDNGNLVNVLTGRDFNNYLYEKLWVITPNTNVVDPMNTESGISFTEKNYIYCLGGDDGIIDDVAIEEGIVKFCEGTLFPEIKDLLRFPMTHLYDCGYSMDTKKALLEAMALRPDAAVLLTTQDLSVHHPIGPAPTYVAGKANPVNGLVPHNNSQYEDESAAISLQAYGLLIPESIDKGTNAMRFSIATQVGWMDSTGELMPCSLRIAEMRSEFMKTSILSEKFGGRPNSECHLFSEVSYTPSSEAEKARLWAAGANYLSYYDRTGIYYSALRTGYSNDSSSLSDLYFVDVLVFTKHAIGKAFTMVAGLQISFHVLQSRISTEIVERLEKIYNGNYVFSVTVYKTKEDIENGYSTHVRVDVTAPDTNRVLKVDINCTKEYVQATEG